MFDVQQHPAEPQQPLVDPTRVLATAPAAAEPSGKPDIGSAAARNIARLAGRKGGSRPKASVPMTGLGDSTPRAVDLVSKGGRFALLTAVVEAAAKGHCSSATASVIIQAVKTAGELAARDQEEAIAALEQRVQELAEGRTITVR